MANIIEFENSLQLPFGVGMLDGSMQLSIPLDFQTWGTVNMQVDGISLSDQIPNIYDAYPTYRWNNTIIQVSTNTLAPVLIQLPRGLYGTVDVIAAKINNAINTNLHWWATPTDPGLSIIADTVTSQIIVMIDSTKLNPLYGTSFRMNIQYAVCGTDMAYTLGFTQGAANFIGVAGTTVSFVCDDEPMLDTQGDVCDVICSLVHHRSRNNKEVKTLARVSFAGKNTLSNNIWPPGGQLSPMMVYSGPRVVKEISFRIQTRDGYPMLFMNGYINVVIAFYHSISL